MGVDDGKAIGYFEKAMGLASTEAERVVLKGKIVAARKDGDG
jgi:hypothetical protein